MVDPGPGGRFDHTMSMVGSKPFVFGGQIGGKFYNDMWTCVELEAENSGLEAVRLRLTAAETRSGLGHWQEQSRGKHIECQCPDCGRSLQYG